VNKPVVTNENHFIEESSQDKRTGDWFFCYTCETRI
jgi:hypothetical protein